MPSARIPPRTPVAACGYETPLDDLDGVAGGEYLAVEVPDDVFAQREWTERWKSCREALIPASVLNKCSISRWA
jgi:hypothetical protein